jgi:hypothetical protein
MGCSGRAGCRQGNPGTGSVDIDPKSGGFREFDGSHGTIVDAVLANRAIVILAVAVEMDRPAKIRARLELVNFLLEQQSICAEIDESLFSNHAPCDLVYFAMQQGLATCDDDHRRPAFVGRRDAFIDAEALVEDCVRIVDLAATGTCEIAAEQRLEHQDERVAAHAFDVLGDHVGADPNRLAQRNRHGKPRGGLIE